MLSIDQRGGWWKLRFPLALQGRNCTHHGERSLTFYHLSTRNHYEEFGLVEQSIGPKV